MNRLKESNLKLQPQKCEFIKEEIKYLGHTTRNGVTPDTSKVDAVMKFSIPKNVKNVKQFLGLIGYYRKFVHNFANIAKPLTNLLKKDQKFKWTEEINKAFEILKGKLSETLILQFPDYEKPFILTTDASEYAIGGALSQGQLGEDLPVAYVSRSLNDTEKRYDVTEHEALACVHCITHWRHYLYGRKFTLVTDHRALML